MRTRQLGESSTESLRKTRTLVDGRAVVIHLRETSVAGHPVRYRVAGAGEPLVLVHGLAGSLGWWAPLLDLLIAHRRVYAVNLPTPRRAFGFGEMSTWLSCWLDGADVGRADLVGHSLGGFFTAQLAARQSGRVRRLVLVAPIGIPWRHHLPGRATALLHTLYDIRSWGPMVAADALHTGVVALARGVRFASRCDLRAELAAVRAPTMLAWGVHDRLVPFVLAEEWQRLVPRARVVQLQCGHVPMLEAPRALAASMLSFLDE
jgi:pimeloyl-ACP methyl ester carboxylesterase